MKYEKNLSLTKIIIFLLVFSMLMNVFQYNKHSQYIRQVQANNSRYMWSISVTAENIADSLDKFVGYAAENNDEKKDIKTMTSTWRVVLGESNSIKFYLGQLSPQYMGALAEEWVHLQYVLLRAETPVNDLNIKFLERSSYSLNLEERKVLETVATIYRRISEGVDRVEYPVININPGLIDSLTEPMMIVDPHYSTFLGDRINNESFELD